MSKQQPPPYPAQQQQPYPVPVGAPPAYSTGGPSGLPPPPPPGMQPPVMRFGEVPVPMTCKFCAAQVITGTQYKNGLMTWIAVGGICLIGAMVAGLLWLGCCLIPFCVNACKDVQHTCPNCNRVVGVYDRTKNF